MLLIFYTSTRKDGTGHSESVSDTPWLSSLKQRLQRNPSNMALLTSLLREILLSAEGQSGSLNSHPIPFIWGPPSTISITERVFCAPVQGAPQSDLPGFKVSSPHSQSFEGRSVPLKENFTEQVKS